CWQVKEKTETCAEDKLMDEFAPKGRGPRTKGSSHNDSTSSFLIISPKLKKYAFEFAQKSEFRIQLVEERYSDDGVLELEGEASYNSFSDPRRSQHNLSASDSFGKFDVKAKGAATQRPRCGLRRRRRASIDNGKFTSGSSYDHVRSDARALCWSPSEPSKLGNVENSTLVHSRGNYLVLLPRNWRNHISGVDPVPSPAPPPMVDDDDDDDDVVLMVGVSGDPVP
ncbi:hypothetical protein BVRB_014510, partial [Beta vulgaris subsp. vulgaris]